MMLLYLSWYSIYLLSRSKSRRNKLYGFLYDDTYILPPQHHKMFGWRESRLSFIRVESSWIELKSIVNTIIQTSGTIKRSIFVTLLSSLSTLPILSFDSTGRMMMNQWMNNRTIEESNRHYMADGDVKDNDDVCF
jgi:hypothetical protein